ncbi:DUF2971 domain-containing protein [Alicyclobacillus dauci]|uniref:DUF2971 domain-containing protein n=1 Tax=Alicyclobacillus dauci TaxID=1475485 RepID=A0ABY6Z5V6_9BACL|nr:DUF2971 domain-containing protein [Alicyclobacillus dauci]WAH38250.1 DUF2971 domain-containing protein [Alicyclobacillus dauci]
MDRTEIHQQYLQLMTKTFIKISELTYETVATQRKSFGKSYTYESPIYHYTSLDGLMNIIKNDCLWASDARYLNDSEELIHGARAMNDIVDQRLKLNPDPNQMKFLEYLHYRLNDVLQGRSRFVEYYVVSLSRDNDSLSQWRAYGDVAIEFDFSPFLRQEVMINKRHVRELTLLDVIYGTDQFSTGVINQLIDFSYEQLSNSPDTDLWGRALASALSILVCISKHQTFYEESEIRYVYLHQHDDDNKLTENFRIKNHRIIPYVELKSLNRLAIKAIWLSPLLRNNTTKSSIEYFLRSVGRSDITVMASESPYRS